MNAFFTSQSSYCPLVWMCRSRTNNNKINRLHERCLRIVYNDKQSSLNELLEKDGSVSIHMKNIQIIYIYNRGSMITCYVVCKYTTTT